MQNNQLDAPSKRILLNKKDQVGQIQSQRFLTVYFTAQSINNPQVQQNLQQAEVFGEQGQIREAEEIIKKLLNAGLIILNDQDAQMFADSQNSRENKWN